MLMCIKWFISLFCSCYQCKAWVTRRSGRYQKRRRGVKEENGKEEEEINMEHWVFATHNFYMVVFDSEM